MHATRELRALATRQPDAATGLRTLQEVGVRRSAMRSWVLRYLVALGSAAASVVVAVALEPDAGGLSMLIIPLVVFESAWIGGLGPGLLATLVGVVGTVWFALEPSGSGAIVNPAERVAVGVLITAGVGLSGLGAGLQRARARAAAERASLRLESQYRVLFDANPEPMWLYDKDSLRFLAVNRATVQHYGYSVDEMLKMTLTDIRPAEDVERFAAARARLGPELEIQGAVAPGVFRHLTKDGRIVHADIRVSMVDFAGRRCVLVLARDVSARVGLEEELRRARDVAEAASAAKDRFLAILSHELRTPLTPLLAAVSSMKPHELTPEELERWAAVVRRSVESEVRLIDDLLDVTRIGSGKLELRVEPVDLSVAVQHVREICEADLRAKEIALTIDLRDAAPGVLADPSRLRQILWNLVRNAVRFTPNGGRITIRSRDEDGRVVIEVADTGAGIRSADLERVFLPFEQLDGARQAGGLGLGLALCRGLVEALGGTIRAESDGVGLGTTLIFELPASAEAPDSPAPSERPAKAHCPLRILLVEDDEDTREILASLLRHAGHQVLTADRVATAIAWADRELVDVLVSDLGLPDGSGLDVMKRLRERGAVRGVALSGYGTEQDARRALDAGFTLHLTKPVTAERLLAAIEPIASAGSLGR